MKYRKKPIVIEAIQLQSTDRSIREVLEFMGQKVDTASASASGNFYKYCCSCREDNGLIIKTLEGQHIASFGDYIIKGVQGEFYPCKPDIFAATYEEVKS